MGCKHDGFEATVNIEKVVEKDNPNVLVGRTASVKIKCVDCGDDFAFINPFTNEESTEIRIAVKPARKGKTISMNKKPKKNEQ